MKNRAALSANQNGDRSQILPERDEASTANNALKFGSYFRDAGTGLDYADQPGNGSYRAQ